MQAQLPEIQQLTQQLNASTEELSDVRFQLEEDKATASAAQVSTCLRCCASTTEHKDCCVVFGGCILIIYVADQLSDQPHFALRILCEVL